MKKTKTQQFSKFFLKDLKTKETIYNKENYLEKSNFSPWNYFFLENWQIYRALHSNFSQRQLNNSYNYYLKHVIYT